MLHLAVKQTAGYQSAVNMYLTVYGCVDSKLQNMIVAWECTVNVYLTLGVGI